MLRRFQRRVQLALVGMALLLSAGVVEVMEVPRRLPAEAGRAPASRPAPAPSSAPPLLTPLARPDLPSTFATSILDDELAAPRESDRARTAPPAAGEPDDSSASDGPSLEVEPPGANALAPVPQPATGLLLGIGLVWIAALRGRERRPRRPSRLDRYSTIAINSTSNVSAAPGGICGGAPRSP